MSSSFLPFRGRLVAGLFVVALLAGCGKHPEAAAPSPDVDYYTCTMHPSVRSHDPHGKCPICSMDLVPVFKKGTAGAETQTTEGVAVASNHEFVVPVERQQQIGVTYGEAKIAPLKRSIRAAGIVTADTTRRWEFVARVQGYVQKLEVTSPGEPVQNGQALMSIYSPDLFVTEREMVNQLNDLDHATTADARARLQLLIDSEHRRLEQWNVSPRQIAEVENSRKAPENLTLYSPFDGVVEEVPVQQGRQVMPGDHLVNVVDLSTVWVWAEFYENELAQLVKGQKVVVTTSSYPGETFDGVIALVSPFVTEMKRTAKVRLDIPNPGYKLRPGMFVNVELAIDHGHGLAIPVSAVMPTGGRALVFVGHGEGRLEPRQVRLGDKFGELYEVKGGLKEGEHVVASANFLIDAESKVQGAVKSFEDPATDGGRRVPLPAETGPLFQPVIAAYLPIERMLAQDKTDGLVPSLSQLREKVQVVVRAGIKPAEHMDEYDKHLGALSASLEKFKTDTIDDARVSFGHVSDALIKLLSEFPPPLGKPLYVVNCPMWLKSPAGWIQAGTEVANPFMGARMPTCGDVVDTIKGGK